MIKTWSSLSFCQSKIGRVDSLWQISTSDMWRQGWPAYLLLRHHLLVFSAFYEKLLNSKREKNYPRNWRQGYWPASVLLRHHDDEDNDYDDSLPNGNSSSSEISSNKKLPHINQSSLAVRFIFSWKGPEGPQWGRSGNVPGTLWTPQLSLIKVYVLILIEEDSHRTFLAVQNSSIGDLVPWSVCL